MRITPAIALAGLLAAPALAQDADLAAQGEKLFKRCAVCHKLEEGATSAAGPSLHGVIGRTAGTEEGFDYSPAMVEAGANEVPEEQMLDGIMYAHEQIKQVAALIEEMRQAVGKPKIEPELAAPNPEVEAWAESFLQERLPNAVQSPDKLAREEAVENVRDEMLAAYTEEHGEDVLEAAQ